MNGDNGRIWLLIIIACGVSIWLTVLFVRLCRDVKAVKTILMTACGLEEFTDYGGIAYRRKRSVSAEEGGGRRSDFLE